MATQKIPVPIAEDARNILQNVENLFNLALVERVFEDASIPDSKLVNPPGGSSLFAVQGNGALYGNDQTGNYRGANAIDIQTSRMTANQVPAGNSSIAIGVNIELAGASNIGIGPSVYSAYGTNNIGIGNGVNVTGVGATGGNIGIGQGASTYSSISSIAIGLGATAYFGTSAIAIGNGAYAQTSNAIAIGTGANAAVANSVAIGPNVVSGLNAVSLGTDNTRKFVIDRNSTAQETNIQLYDNDNAQMERVSVGAADSGGAGYKVLRIPN